MGIGTPAAVIGLLFWGGAAWAGCVGSTSIKTCTDGLGNTYTIQRLGDVTFVTGLNERTGEGFSETTRRFGDIVVTDGEGGGRTWTSTQSKLGPDMHARSGTDPEGRRFEHFCTKDGCE
jgi:hypothetical protein